MALTLWVAARLYASPQRRRQFEACYATVNARLADCVFWAVRHSVAAVRQGVGRNALLWRAGLALIVLGLCVAAPYAAIASSDSTQLGGHEFAAAVGALVWACAIEGAAIGERLEKQMSRQVITAPPWLLIVVFLFFDAVVGALALGEVAHDPSMRAALIGAAFVALADAVSIVLGFYLSPFSPYPLGDP